MKLSPPSLPVITIPALLWLTFACSSVRPLHPAAAPPPYVILKLDDAWYERGFIHPGWTQVFDYLNDKDIVATIGIVGERMQDGSPEYYDWLKAQNARGQLVNKPPDDPIAKTGGRRADWSFGNTEAQAVGRLVGHHLQFVGRTRPILDSVTRGEILLR